MGRQDSEKHLGWQIFAQATVVVLGLAAVVVCLALILNAYEVSEDPAPTTNTLTAATQQTAASDGAPAQPGEQDGGATTPAAEPSGTSTSVSSSSVVAILTPIMAGIVGIAGLFFGISSTGSARGRQAGADQTVADTTAKAADASAKAVDLVAEVQQKEGPGASQGRQQSPPGDDVL
jgi:hypothetical protein